MRSSHCSQVVATKDDVEPRWVVAVAAQPMLMMLMLLSAGHLLLIVVDDNEGCMLWARHLDVVVAAALLSLSISALMSGSSLYCLSLMTSDEPDGELAMTTAGWRQQLLVRCPAKMSLPMGLLLLLRMMLLLPAVYC